MSHWKLKCPTSHRYASTACRISEISDTPGLNSSVIKLSCPNKSNKMARRTSLYPPWKKNARRKRDALKCGNAHFWSGSTLGCDISFLNSYQNTTTSSHASSLVFIHLDLHDFFPFVYQLHNTQYNICSITILITILCKYETRKLKLFFAKQNCDLFRIKYQYFMLLETEQK